MVTPTQPICAPTSRVHGRKGGSASAPASRRAETPNTRVAMGTRATCQNNFLTHVNTHAPLHSTCALHLACNTRTFPRRPVSYRSAVFKYSWPVLNPGIIVNLMFYPVSKAARLRGGDSSAWCLTWDATLNVGSVMFHVNVFWSRALVTHRAYQRESRVCVKHALISI